MPTLSLPDAVTVRVPGSTSNCGAGFDSLGLAMALYNRVRVAWVADESATITPETAGDAAGLELVREAAQAFWRETGHVARAFRYTITGEVPPSRGLGSSVTVLAGIAGALNALQGEPLSRHQLVALVTTLEGHPDNAAPGVLGGFCVARSDPMDGRYLDCVRVEVTPEVRFVVASPEVEISTKASRGALPDTLPFIDAVRSVNAAVYLTAALTAGNWEKLRQAGGDWLHEPYRLPGIPGAAAAIAAGVAAGGWTGWLSGSGSSVMVMSGRESAPAVAAAMQEAFAAAGVATVTVRDLAADHTGLVVEAT
jgi:homoserine kinase